MVRHNKVRLHLETLEDRMMMASQVINTDLIVLFPHFNNFDVVDAAADDTAAKVFVGGALKVNYDFQPVFNTLNKVTLEAWQGGAKVAEFGSFNSLQVSNGYAGLYEWFWPLGAGSYSIRARADLTNGTSAVSGWKTIEIAGGSVVNGTFQGETFAFSSMTGKAIIVNGAGGTDTLKFNVPLKKVVSINGMAPGSFNAFTESQPIFQGKLVDYIRLKNGTELYVTGVERLMFKTTVKNLAASAYDARYADQWNLHSTDVPNAWRFTKGSANVLIASLDTGVLPNSTLGGQVTDISLSRLITDATDDDGYTDGYYGHGHQAISVMAATANSKFGVVLPLDGVLSADAKASVLWPVSTFGVGINQQSKVYVNDVYHGVTLQSAISSTLAYAQANNMKVVFQGGIQGEGWLNHGGTQAALESMISNAASYSLFAVAAGNYYDANSVSGVAKLQTNHGNVMSVGALQRTGATVNGFANASAVNLASYSNHGANLTIVAPTDSLATTQASAVSGDMNTFGGTSCANPNMAAIASLIWSANPNLTGAQVRAIATSTAMDLGDAGRDNTYGNGLVNADLAVRRARAMYLNPALANSNYWNPLIFNPVIFDVAVSASVGKSAGAPSQLNAPPQLSSAPAFGEHLPQLHQAVHVVVTDTNGDGEKNLDTPPQRVTIDLAFATLEKDDAANWFEMDSDF